MKLSRTLLALLIAMSFMFAAPQVASAKHSKAAAKHHAAVKKHQKHKKHSAKHHKHAAKQKKARKSAKLNRGGKHKATTQHAI